jgi:predicted porin
LGRDYTPIFWNTTIFDPFGTNGVGQSIMPGSLAVAGVGALRGLGIDPTTGAGAAIAAKWTNGAAVRASNSVGYFLPNLGGIYGQIMYAFGEQSSEAVTTATSCGAIVSGTTTLYTGLPAGTSTKSDGNHVSGRIGFANGPIDVAVAFGTTKNACAKDLKTTNVGASYNFGMVKPMLAYEQEKNGFDDKVTGWLLGATAPLGGGELRASYAAYKVDSPILANDSNFGYSKVALGYGYNLSRRTQVYGTFSQVSNKDQTTVAVSNNGLTEIAPPAGKKSNGFEFGVRHSF